jgi:hypothetical protein
MDSSFVVLIMGCLASLVILYMLYESFYCENCNRKLNKEEYPYSICKNCI